MTVFERRILPLFFLITVVVIEGQISREECENQGGSVIGDIGNGVIFKADYVCSTSYGGQPPSDIVIAGPGEPIASDGEVCCGGTGKGLEQNAVGNDMGLPILGNDSNGSLPQLPLDGGQETFCATDKDCETEEMTSVSYCSKGICRPIGYCDSLIDCYNPSNTYAEIFCIGEKFCRNNACMKDCGVSDCPKGLNAVNCFASPCSNEPPESCLGSFETDSVSCMENYCGGCNALHFDPAGHHVCQETTVYPPPNNPDQVIPTSSLDDELSMCGSPMDACMNTDNYKKCVSLKQTGCTSIMVMESCPLQFACGDDPSAMISSSHDDNPEEDSPSGSIMRVLSIEILIINFTFLVAAFVSF